MCTRASPNRFPANASPLPDKKALVSAPTLPRATQEKPSKVNQGYAYYKASAPPNQGGKHMKELTSYNRVAGYLNKIFDLLNEEYFESTLTRPTITIQSTPRAYGHFSLRDDTWISKNGASHEINIGAGTLARPIEEVCATLLHEMVHYHNYILGVQDCSRGGTYHNKRFKASAEAHGLLIDHDKKYGWTKTAPSDSLLEFVLKNGLTDILLNRNEHAGFQITGTGTHNGAPTIPGTGKTSSTRKYACPCCGLSVRATRVVRVSCMACNEPLLLVG